MGKLNEEIVLDLIVRLRGNVSAIARACQVDRNSAINYIGRRPALRRALRNARAAVGDEARDSLARQVEEGKPWAVKLALQGAKPDELDEEGDDDVPELTDTERLALLERLVESAKEETLRRTLDRPPAEGE